MCKHILHQYQDPLSWSHHKEPLVDLGFDNWTLKRLRLQGVNTSELNGEEKQRAQAAKTFVQDKLKDVEQIVLQTQKTDLHGRYVAHVFYHPALTDKEEIFAKGYFLNEQLLEAGLEEVMVSNHTTTN